MNDENIVLNLWNRELLRMRQISENIQNKPVKVFGCIFECFKATFGMEIAVASQPNIA